MKMVVVNTTFHRRLHDMFTITDAHVRWMYLLTVGNEDCGVVSSNGITLVKYFVKFSPNSKCEQILFTFWRGSGIKAFV
jgi:hypothetical protein